MKVMVLLLWGINSLCLGTTNDYHFTKKIGDYSIELSRSSDWTAGTFIIKQKEKSIFKVREIGAHFDFGNQFDNLEVENRIDPYSGKDLTGNQAPELLVSKFTGGAHCCNILYIFELGKNLEKLAVIDGGSHEIRLIDLDRDGIPEIELWDGSIDYQFACFAGSPPGRIVLKFTGARYEVARQLMERPMPTLNNLKEKKSVIKRAFRKNDSPDLPYEFLHLMMDLSYSHHLTDAMQIADDIWPPQKPGLEKFKNEFKKNLKESQYWPKEWSIVGH